MGQGGEGRRSRRGGGKVAGKVAGRWALGTPGQTAGCPKGRGVCPRGPWASRAEGDGGASLEASYALECKGRGGSQLGGPKRRTGCLGLGRTIFSANALRRLR